MLLKLFLCSYHEINQDIVLQTHYKTANLQIDDRLSINPE